MSKFIPGPWRIEKGKKNLFLSVDTWMQFVKIYENSSYYGVSEANAKLISKAPEMYELLKEIFADPLSKNWFSNESKISKLLKEIDE